MISVRALGPLEVTVNGKPAPPDLLWRHNLALLLYLARAPAHRCTRDHAVGLLWPEKPQASARQSLRQALGVLRRCVGETFLLTEADQLQLTEGAVDLDTDRFDKLIATGDLSSATPLVAGEFADGFALDEASPFEDWLHAERWHWRGRTMDVLIQHAEQRLDAGDLLGADEPARRAMNLDPGSERALRTMMRRLALAGDRSGALRIHDQFVKRAAEQHAAPPQSETRALAERVRTQREWVVPINVAPPRVPLFGREPQLAQILGHWRTARSKRLALVMIEAAGGAGKTRLAEEVIARAVLDGGVAIATRAVPADRQQAMSGIVALTRGGLVAAAGVVAASSAALAALAHESSEWAERFPAPGGSSAKPLGTAVIEVLKAASVEQPLLLVLDDAQWLDEESLGVVETMVRDLAATPILILLAASAAPATPRLAQLRAAIGRDVPGSVTRLATFDEPTLQTMVRWFFPEYTTDQVNRLTRRLAADSAGVPLLAVEICHAITQGLDLNSQNSAWPSPLKTLDQTRPGELPETIVAAIRVGFNALTASAGAALKAAAVLGDRVSARRISRATGLTGNSLDAALDELEWRRWLVADARGYSFVARIVREVVERDMVTEGERLRILNA